MTDEIVTFECVCRKCGGVEVLQLPAAEKNRAIMQFVQIDEHRRVVGGVKSELLTATSELRVTRGRLKGAIEYACRFQPEPEAEKIRRRLAGHLYDELYGVKGAPPG